MVSESKISRNSVWNVLSRYICSVWKVCVGKAWIAYRMMNEEETYMLEEEGRL